jgi:hypothetical protein
LKAKYEGGSSYHGFKRLVPGVFQELSSRRFQHGSSS